MPKVKIELIPSGIIELFKSSEVQGALQEAGNAVANRATGMSGEEYEARVHNAGFTAIANVYPASAKAAHDNFSNNTLLKAACSAGLPQTKPHL